MAECQQHNTHKSFTLICMIPLSVFFFVLFCFVPLDYKEHQNKMAVFFSYPVNGQKCYCPKDTVSCQGWQTEQLACLGPIFRRGPQALITYGDVEVEEVNIIRTRGFIFLIEKSFIHEKEG